MSITDWLDQAQARADAATKGPWAAIGRDDSWLRFGDIVDGGEPGNRVIIAEHAGYDAEFIAAARTDLPAAIAALRAVQSYLDDLDYQFAGYEVRAAEVVADIERTIATALGVTS